MEVHSQSTVSAQMVTPSDGTDSLIEVRIIASRERLHAEEHSAGQPGPQTYPVSSTQNPGESNTCPGRRDLLGSQVPQFVRQHVFHGLSLIHISEPTRLRRISYAVFCLK